MSTDIDTRIRDLQLRAELGEDALQFEVDIAGTEDQLWEAITQPEMLARWSPIVPDRPLTSIGPAQSRETPDAEPVAADVLALAGQHAITHRWGEDTVEWMVEDGRLVCRMLLATPEHAPYYAAGWQVCLGVLDALLSGEEQERIVGMDAMAHGWEELRRMYVEELDCPDIPLEG